MGVFGIIGKEKCNVASSVYYGLYALQHRGQESVGIVVNDDGLFTSYKDSGLVGDVFSGDKLKTLGEGNAALGHCRYGTLGTKGRANAEPIVVNHIKGRLALATDGRLVNADKLRRELELRGMIFHTSSDAELISYIITAERLTSPSIEEAVNRAMSSLDGGYSLLLMSPRKLIAARDPRGMKPLCYGMRDNGQYVVATESCALDTVGAAFVREIEPGEIVVFTGDGVSSINDHCKREREALCVFEYVYTARPDSEIAGCSVQVARKRAGALLAKAHPVDADVVVGVPDSGLDAALGYAEESGIPYGIGLIKNKYIGRTFISPGQSDRFDKVRIKLSPVNTAVKGKRVILIDDSIVRGTTSGRIVKLLRDAGATEIHMRVSAPPFLHPCYYGTDIDSEEHLIACHHTIEAIAKMIGVDSLGYLPKESLSQLIGGKNFCSACFDGQYPTEIPKNTCKNRFEQKLSERKK